MSDEKLKSYSQDELISLFSAQSILKIGVETAKAVNKDAVRTLLRDPIKNAHKLQDLSWYLYYTSGQYKRNINYLSDLLTYDYYVTPSETLSNANAYKKYFEKTCNILKGMNIKFNTRWIHFYLLLLGELYIYEIGNDKDMLYTIIPNSICRVVEYSNGVSRFAVDLTKIKKDMLDVLPDEIVKAYEKGRNVESDYGRGMYLVSEKGIGLNPIYNKSHGVPPFALVFDDILNLDDVKDISFDNQKAEALKLIHQEVPLDDKKKPSIGIEHQKMYHRDTLKAVPKNIAVTTTPLTTKMLSFVDSQSRDKYYLSLAKGNVADSFGVSAMLFNSDGASGEALKKSIMVDELMVYGILPTLENFINNKLKNFKFSMQFLRTTYNNRWEQAKAYKDSLSIGGSSLVYMAYLGFEPFQIIELLKFERDVLDIDSLITPKKTSHTLSSDDVGREKSDNPTDSTEKARESN